MSSRHHAVSLVTLGALVLGAGVAHAQELDSIGDYRAAERRRHVESPQHAAFELRVGRYVPNIDDEFNGPTPYETTFGPKNRYSVGLEVDWQLFRIPYVGTLGPGLGVGYTKMTARSFVVGSGQRSGEDTSLTIFPIYLMGVLRGDFIARETPVPLVPYVKFGVGATPWRITNGGGTAHADSLAGSGLSVGPQFALGGMFLLDFLDQSSAMNLDNEVGINNSYFFMEWYVSKLGSGDQLEVGTNTWVLGLAFEM